MAPVLRPIRGALGWVILPTAPLIGFHGSTEIAKVAPAATYFHFSPAPRAGAAAVSVQTAASQVWVRQVVDVLNNTQRGKLNATTTITFTPNADSTTLLDPRIGPASFIHLMPTTSDAASTTWYITSQMAGSAVINHPNSPLVDRTYRVLILS